MTAPLYPTPFTYTVTAKNPAELAAIVAYFGVLTPKIIATTLAVAFAESAQETGRKLSPQYIENAAKLAGVFQDVMFPLYAAATDFNEANKATLDEYTGHSTAKEVANG